MAKGSTHVFAVLTLLSCFVFSELQYEDKAILSVNFSFLNTTVNAIDDPNLADNDSSKHMTMCMRENIDLWGKVEWRKMMNYSEEGVILEVPLSFACFMQCWYRIDKMIDEKGIPSSEAIANEVRKDVYPQINAILTAYASAMKTCEALKIHKGSSATDGKGPFLRQILVDTSEGIKDNYKTEICKISVDLDVCAIERMNEFIPRPAALYRNLALLHDTAKYEPCAPTKATLP